MSETPENREKGKVYAFSEYSQGKKDVPFVIISNEEFARKLSDPEIQATHEKARRLLESRVEFSKEVAPGIWVIDSSLALRASIHVLQDNRTRL